MPADADCASRCSPPSASRGPRPAAWPTWSTRSPARSASSAGDERRAAGRRLPAALPGRARAADRRAASDPARAGSAGADRAAATVTDPRRRRPTATGCAWSTTRPAFDRDGLLRRRGRATTPTTPGGSGCSAARRSRRSARTAGRSTSCTSTTGTPARPRSTATSATRTTRSSVGAAMLMTLHNLAYHGWTPRARARPARAGAGRRRSSGPTPTASTCCAPGSSAAELVNTVSPGLRRRGADAGVRDGPRRRAACARATGSSGSSTGSTRRSGIRPRTRTWPRPTRAPTGPARRPAGRTC